MTHIYSPYIKFQVNRIISSVDVPDYLRLWIMASPASKIIKTRASQT